jgi:surfeit locus 1 family protein
MGGVPDPTLAPGQTQLEFWNVVNLERISQQAPYPLLDVYIQPQVDPADRTPPIPFQPELELSEGPHLGYAVQWFIFAGIFILGYPFYLRKQLIKPSEGSLESVSRKIKPSEGFLEKK